MQSHNLPDEHLTEITNKQKTGRGYTRNIPIESIIELRRKDLTEHQIASILGCDRSNVNRRLAKYKDQLDGLDRYKNHRADILAFNQKRLLNTITESDIKSASLLQRTTAFGILYDKERLERNQSTENISVKSIVTALSNDRDDLVKRKASLLESLGVTVTAD